MFPEGSRVQCLCFVAPVHLGHLKYTYFTFHTCCIDTYEFNVRVQYMIHPVRKGQKVATCERKQQEYATCYWRVGRGLVGAEGGGGVALSDSGVHFDVTRSFHCYRCVYRPYFFTRGLIFTDVDKDFLFHYVPSNQNSGLGASHGEKRKEEGRGHGVCRGMPNTTP